MSEIAVASHVGVEKVAAQIDEWPGVFLDDDRRVIGYWGLALPKMAHRFEVNGITTYTWCAWDALFIPELIEQTARVTSKNPVSGTKIELIVSPDHAECRNGSDIYVSFLNPDEEGITSDVIQSFCHYVHFFASEEEGDSWTSEREDTFLLTLDQAFALGKRKNARQYPARNVLYM